MSYQIASLFHMYIYMGERIAGEQDRPCLIIEDPLRAPKIAILNLELTKSHRDLLVLSLDSWST